VDKRKERIIKEVAAEEAIRRTLTELEAPLPGDRLQKWTVAAVRSRTSRREIKRPVATYSPYLSRVRELGPRRG